MNWLMENCKNWVFQLEQGEQTGYLHYQCRFSLRSKTRQTTLAKHIPSAWQYWLTPTSEANSRNFNYVLKMETRVEGPWSDKDDEDTLQVYVPRQVREIKEWRPWQIKVAEMCSQWDNRKINVIYDPVGNNGKTVLACAMECDGKACYIPFCNDFRDIMRMIMDQKKVGAYIIDMPRAINKEKLGQMWAGLEAVKSGFAFDDRYKFKKAWFDCPVMFVMTNKLPSLDDLSPDRWSFWKIVNHHLEKWVPDYASPAKP